MKDNVSFIAEVSSNHHHDLDRCRAFIDKAAEIGCDAVKFQLFKIDQLFASEALARKPELLKRKAWELPVEFLPALSQRSRDREIQFSCTPFYLEAVEELRPFVEFYKIASYELMWKELLVACAQTGKPVVISTGMATLEEVGSAVTALRGAGCKDLTLLHCVSGYPTPPVEANLAAIETMRTTFQCHVGWSDHTVNPGVVYRAVHRWGATVVEFHLDLDGTGEEFGAGHCWLPETVGPVIAGVRAGLVADGDGQKKPAPAELPDRDWRADPSDGLRPLLHVRKKLVS